MLEIDDWSSSALGIQTGGVFVDTECEKYLNTILRKANIGEEDAKEYVAAGVEDFEVVAKREFVSPDAQHHVSFHDNGLKLAELGIRRGRMAIKG